MQAANTPSSLADRPSSTASTGPTIAITVRAAWFMKFAAASGNVTRTIIRASAGSNVLVFEYLHDFQVAERHPVHAVGPVRRALHHGLTLRHADVPKDLLPADEALEAWRQRVAARRTED